MTLGEVARAIRIDANISQREAALRLSVTNVHLNNIEHGRGKPSLSLLKSYEMVFGYDPYVIWWLISRTHEFDAAEKLRRIWMKRFAAKGTPNETR